LHRLTDCGKREGVDATIMTRQGILDELRAFMVSRKAEYALTSLGVSDFLIPMGF